MTSLRGNYCIIASEDWLSYGLQTWKVNSSRRRIAGRYKLKIKPFDQGEVAAAAYYLRSLRIASVPLLK